MPKKEPIELLPFEDPTLRAWISITKILDAAYAPKTGKFPRLKPPRPMKKD